MTAQPGLSSRSGRLFAALAVPNFRLYFAGQAVSLIGTWMQVVAQSWLVLQLTGSGPLLGLVAAAQFLPVLLLGPPAWPPPSSARSPSGACPPSDRYAQRLRELDWPAYQQAHEARG